MSTDPEDYMFQSAPPTGVRGDLALDWPNRRKIVIEVSIRSPHRSEGRCESRTFQSAPPTGVEIS